MSAFRAHSGGASSCEPRRMTCTVLAAHPSRLAKRCKCTARLTPQADDFTRFVVLFFFAAAGFFLDAGFFGRFRTAARCAAASAALAQPANSSGSSNSRAGNCQYDPTVTVLALV